MKHRLLHLMARVLREQAGQDMIEYTLMAGLVAVAAGAVMPNVATSIGMVFSQISLERFEIPAAFTR